MLDRAINIWEEHKTKLKIVFAGLFLIYLLFFLRLPSNLSRSEKVLIDIVHYPLFLYLSFLLIDRYRRYFGKTISIATLIIVIGSISFASEGLQSFTGRTADWRDIGFNMAGLATAIILFHPGIKTLSTGFRKLAMLLLALIAISPVLTYLIYRFDEYRVVQNLPYLNNFDQIMSLSRIEANAIVSLEENSIYNKKSLKINFGTGEYSDIDFRYLPRDWSSFDHIKLELFNPSELPFNITFKLYDSAFNHFEAGNTHVFYKELTVKPGMNKYLIGFDDISQSSNIKFENIETLTLFTYRQRVRHTTWLIDMSLQ